MANYVYVTNEIYKSADIGAWFKSIVSRRRQYWKWTKISLVLIGAVKLHLSVADGFVTRRCWAFPYYIKQNVKSTGDHRGYCHDIGHRAVFKWVKGVK